MSIHTPSYRFHKARNCAVVTINGKDYYLGVYESQESREKYHRLIAEWLNTRNVVVHFVKRYVGIVTGRLFRHSVSLG